MKTAKKYKGFTLMEMIIVIVIFMILFVMSIAAFSGLRATIALNEGIKNLEQDVRNAQRSALLLTRGKDERWMYGVGIDFSTFPETGEYRVFKWCSPFDDYGNILTESDFPNYNPNSPLGTATNGNLPVGPYITDCSRNAASFSNASGSLIESSGTGVVPIEYPIMIGVNKPLQAQGGAPAFPAYVLFESTTGRAFFYDKNGRILNYDQSGNLRSDAFDFEVVLATVDRDHNRKLVIHNASGKIYLDKVPKDELNQWTFPADPASGGNDDNPIPPIPPVIQPPPGNDEIPPGDDEIPPNDDNAPPSDNEDTGPVIDEAPTETPSEEGSEDERREEEGNDQLPSI